MIIIIVCMVLFGNLIILALASAQGITISSEEDLFQLLDDPSEKGLIKTVISINHIVTFICGPLIFLMIYYRNKITTYLQLRHFNPTYLILFPIALFSLYPLMGYLTFFIEQLDLPDFFNKMDKDAMETLSKLLKMDDGVDLFINLMIIGILPGIGEELLFRGIIQKELATKTQKPHIAIWITAIVFSAFHFQLTGFLAKMMIGLVLGYAYHFSKSLILPMILHTLNNSMATISLYLVGSMPEMNPTSHDNVPLNIVVISSMIFVFTMIMIQRLDHPKIVADES
ncbi:MAG: CPBP family intramembrane glutamic endopeptidase [Saprospiraceae bacterium]